MSDQSAIRPAAPGPAKIEPLPVTKDSFLGAAMKRVDEAEAKAPSEGDHVSARAKQRMKESEQDRYNRHKALVRGTMMRVFTETLLPEGWSSKDDAVMDALVTWVIDLQNRANTNAEISVNTIAATTKTEDIEVEQDK